MSRFLLKLPDNVYKFINDYDNDLVVTILN